MMLVIVAATWKQISCNFLFVGPGLQTIPKSLLEAVSIDRACGNRRIWKIDFRCWRR